MLLLLKFLLHFLNLSVNLIFKIIRSLKFLFSKKSNLLSHGKNLVGDIDKLLIEDFMKTALNGVLNKISDLISDKFTLNNFLFTVFIEIPRVHHSIFYLILEYELTLIV